MSWFAFYTRSRAEKKVKENLLSKGYDVYLPLRQEIRLWSDRKKKIDVPALCGYIFVNIDVSQITDVRRIDGIVNVVRNCTDPAIIPDAQIEQLRIFVEHSSLPVDLVSDKLEVGTMVSVRFGRAESLIGELVEYKGKYRVAVRIEGLGCALTEIPLSSIEKI